MPINKADVIGTRDTENGARHEWDVCDMSSEELAVFDSAMEKWLRNFTTKTGSFTTVFGAGLRELRNDIPASLRFKAKLIICPWRSSV